MQEKAGKESVCLASFVPTVSFPLWVFLLMSHAHQKRNPAQRGMRWYWSNLALEQKTRWQLSILRQRFDLTILDRGRLLCFLRVASLPKIISSDSLLEAGKWRMVQEGGMAKTLRTAPRCIWTLENLPCPVCELPLSINVNYMWNGLTHWSPVGG